MPHAVAVTIRFNNGDYGALIAEFSTPGAPPELRYADGLWAFDGERLLELTPLPRLDGDEPLYDLTVTEHLTGGRHVLVIGKRYEDFRVRSVAHTAVSLGNDSDPNWVRISDGAPIEVDYELDMHRTGPGSGFTLVLESGDMFLGLPHRDNPLPLFRDVAGVVSTNWLSDVQSPNWTATAEHYKVVQLIPARGEPARVDGDLEEWRSDEALAVDTRGSVLAGEADWSGPRDGSFGVAARLHHGRLTVVVRVRDDEILVGVDRLEFEVGSDVHVLPIRHAGPVDQGNWSGLEAVFTNAVDFGTGVEASFDVGGKAPRRDALPLVVRYLDADTGQQTTVLATAPSLRSLALNIRMPGE
jgi:hypothetical protein